MIITIFIIIMTLNFEIFTDGSSTGKVGPGGWAFIVVNNELPLHKQSGYSDNTTNNRMELQAAIEALEYVVSLQTNPSIILYSDSQYVIKGSTIWRNSWENKIQQGKQIINQDLWEIIWNLADNIINIDFRWINGHSGIFWNEQVDKLAKFARISPPSS